MLYTMFLNICDYLFVAKGLPFPHSVNYLCPSALFILFMLSRVVYTGTTWMHDKMKLSG